MQIPCKHLFLAFLQIMGEFNVKNFKQTSELRFLTNS